MKKIMIMILAGLVMSTAAFSEGLFIRLGGGVTSLTGGDYSAVIQGRNDLYNNFPGLTVSSQLEKLSLGAFMAGEFIYCPSDYFGVGLGVDYLQGTNDSTLNAVGTDLTETLYFDSKSATALGVQGSLGLELALSDVVFLGIEAKGRILEFNKIEGSWDLIGSTSSGLVQDSGSGTAWYEELQSGTNYYPTLVYKGLEPGGVDVRNVRKFVIGMSGLGIQLSLRFEL
jgi:hypothetical protein